MKELVLDGQKLAYHKKRLEAWLRGERIAPITIDCALTRRCTYRCVYCYGALQSNDEKKITKDVIFRFLDDAADIGVKGVSFVSDGESTCSPYFYDAVLRGKANGLDMAVGTNGCLLKEDRLEEVLSALTYIRFNISAAEGKRYAQIHGTDKKCLERVIKIIRRCVDIKKNKLLGVTIGLQMVFLPRFSDQVIPLAKLGKELGVDYVIFKHCSDDEAGSLKVDYSKYRLCIDILKEAEKYSTRKYKVAVKWSKILSGGKRKYRQCYGPAFIMQFSGSGLVAPCGMLFNSKYKKYHIGNIAEKSFKEIWQSERYRDVLNFIASDKFDARTMCGTLCLQHKVNEFLWDLKSTGASLPAPKGRRVLHKNFI